MKKTGLRKNAAGLYLAVAVSAAAVGAVAWLATAGLETEPDPDAQIGSQLTASVPSSESEEEVIIPKSDVPKESSSEPENFVVSFPDGTAEVTDGAEQTASLPEEDAEVVQPVSDLPKEEETQSLAWISPVDGSNVTNPYSNGELVKSRTLGEWRTHDGIDIAAAEGDTVKAVADGVVKDVRQDSRWGWTVEVEHGDVTVYYCGLAETVKVKAGQEVKQGDALGEVGNSSVLEASEEPHIHLAMKRDGKWIDPAEMLGL